MEKSNKKRIEEKLSSLHPRPLSLKEREEVWNRIHSNLRPRTGEFSQSAYGNHLPLLVKIKNSFMMTPIRVFLSVLLVLGGSAVTV